MHTWNNFCMKKTRIKDYNVQLRNINPFLLDTTEAYQDSSIPTKHSHNSHLSLFFMTCVINIIHKTEPLHYFIAYKTANVFTVVMKITPYQCHCKAKQSTFVRAKRSLSSISLLIVIINIESNSLCISPLTRLVIHKRAQVVKAKETKLYYIKKQKELFHIDPLKALSKAKTFCLNSYFVRKVLLWVRFWLLHLFFLIPKTHIYHSISIVTPHTVSTHTHQEHVPTTILHLQMWSIIWKYAGIYTTNMYNICQWEKSLVNLLCFNRSGTSCKTSNSWSVVNPSRRWGYACRNIPIK